MDSIPIVREKENLPFELSSLSRAVNYQQWVFRTVTPYLGSRIMEVGAGIGNMSQWLPVGERLILTETDPTLMRHLAASMTKRGGGADPRVLVRSFDVARDDLAPLIAENLDTIVSFNVLEHIDDDLQAVQRLSELLQKSQAPGPKRLVTFVPAHSWAHGSMDREFGHFRRYSKGRVRALHRGAAPEAKLTLRYFNLFGLPGWLVHGKLLQRRNISMGAIATFERLCPILAPLDDFAHRFLRMPMGQSILFVMEWPHHGS